MPTPSSAIQAEISNPLNPRVLLVEDDAELRDALTENLQLNGMLVYAVETGAEFRTALRMGEVDAVVIDVNLPDASGFELARELSSQDDRPGVIMLTARTQRDDRLQGYVDGADIYMTKPVDNEELVLAIRNLARRVARARQDQRPESRADSVWRLDVARRLLTSPEGKAIGLSGREVMLLELFEKAGGGPVSRAYVASIMGYGAPGPQRRGLDAALRRLKDKASKRNVELPLLIVHTMGIRFIGQLIKTQ